MIDVWKMKMYATPDSIISNNFWSLAPNKSEYECWPWLGAKDNRRCNYGRFFDGEKTTFAHIVAYKLIYGNFPSRFENGRKVFVRHKCGNYRCCNPNHLDIGTASDNAKDIYKVRGFNIEQRRLKLVSEGVK